MIFYVGNTDFEWFKFLCARSPEDINFWQPGGRLRFQAIQQGAPFLLRLKAPHNKIAGIGFFSSHSLLPIDFAWDVFEERNGVASLEVLKRRINSYRNIDNSLEVNSQIGCIILTNPVFFREEDWLATPSDWSPNIVQGKTYDSSIGFGKELWRKIEDLLDKYRLFEQAREKTAAFEIAEDDSTRYGSEVITRVRLGQGAFRVLITDTYHRRCAISGERTLPVLEAAHIMPYDHTGPHMISNGLLLRADIHKLFDKGYLTVTNQYKIEVSHRIRSEFENGHDYYHYHGKDLASTPTREVDKPAISFLDWHNQQVYKG
jgi:putative restriction endonuclease